MLIIGYTFIVSSTLIDEVWNIYNPRPEPLKIYMAVQWEQSDFYTKKLYGEFILKQYRESDNYIKRHVRKMYWIEMLEKYPYLKK